MEKNSRQIQCYKKGGGDSRQAENPCGRVGQSESKGSEDHREYLQVFAQPVWKI